MANKNTYSLRQTDRDLTEKKIHVIAEPVVRRLTELYYDACILELAVVILLVYYRTLVMFCTFTQMKYLGLNVKRTAADGVVVMSFSKSFAPDVCVGLCK